METMLYDLRYALRSLRKSPGFALMAVLVLMLGIGANTAIFSVVNAVLLQQLPFRDPQQLVSLSSRRTDRDNMPISIPDFEDFHSQSRSFQNMAAFAMWGANLTGEGEPERILEARVSADFFPVMGTTAYLGRTLLPEDDKPGSARVAVMSYGLWQRRFGADRALVGKTLRLNGEAHTVVGVLPPNFFFPRRGAEMAVPLGADADPRRNDRGDHFLDAVGRLRAGVSQEQATAELNAIARHLQQQYPKTNSKNTGVTLVALSDLVVGKFRAALLLLMGAVGLLLLIACSSLANLLLARASTRGREIAIRSAMGANRARLVRQLVTETLLLSLLGGAAGLMLAAWGLRGLVALSPADLPRAGEIAVNAHVLWFAAGLSLLAGAVFGIVPALQSINSSFDHLRASGALAAGAGYHVSRARGFIVATQVALSLVLLVGAGLLLKSFARLQAVHPGFDPDHVLALRISLPQAAFSSNDAIANFYGEFRRRAETLPGVAAVGGVSILPLSGPDASVDFTIAGHASSPGSMPGAQYRVIGPGFLRAMAIPLLEGRDFAESDTPHSARVLLVNQTLARQYFGTEHVVGEHLTVEDTGEAEIVGVMNDVRQMSLDEEPQPNIYAAYSQVAPFALPYLRNNMFWTVRTTVDPLSVATAVRHELRAVQNDAPIARIGAMEDYLAASAAPRRFNLLLVTMFGATALLLAIVGVYGVISYSVTRRAREFGVRMALGAQRRDVLIAVLLQAGRVVGAGMVAGLLGAAACTRLLTDILFQVRPTDVTTYLIVVGLVAAAALLACCIPALKAASTDPMVALRHE